MTKTEHELLQARVRAIALETLLDYVADILRLILRSLTLIGARLRQAKADHQSMAFPQFPPELSDLYAAEFQEAFDDLSEKLLEDLGRDT